MGRVVKVALPSFILVVLLAQIAQNKKEPEEHVNEVWYESVMPEIQDIELMEEVLGWREIERKLLKKEEGLRLVPYKDSLGHWTVGYGHHSNKIGPNTRPWTLEEAEEQLSYDFETAETAARRAVATFDNLNGCRKGVLVQMAFQMGEGGLRSFVNTIRHINDENYMQAAANMRRSLWARQTPGRANRMAKRMETGEY